MSEQESPRGPLAPTDLTAESPFTLPGFFAAMEDGRLLAAVCTDCETRLIPPRPACSGCGSRAVEIEVQPPTGEIISYTEVNRPPTAFADLAPFPVAIVELGTGARLTGRVDADYDDLEIGTPVRFHVRKPDFDPSASLPYETSWPLHVFEPV